MGYCVTIAGDQGKIALDVSAYENVSATNLDDANWLSTDLSLEVGPFSGSFKAALTTHDFANLYDQLKRVLDSLSGTVSFQNLEEDISIAIEINKRGAASVSGVARPHGPMTASLHFRFNTDQSVLTKTLRELEVVLRKFPAKVQQ